MADGQNRHLPDFDVEHRNHSDFYRDGSGRFYLCRRQQKLFGDQLCRRFPAGRCYANRSGGWIAEFVEDDGSGGYNVIARPEWLTAFTASATAVRLPRRSRLRPWLNRE